MLIQLLATFASGIFAGAALYVTFVEQPARLSCGSHFALTQWRPSYKRGTLMQAPLALIGSISGLLSWWVCRNSAWLLGGLLLLLVIPFTLLIMFPTNKRLESQELDPHSEQTGRLLRRWGQLHAVRSLLGAVAFLIFLFALARRF
jgi:uncharacterized membrane protein